MLVEAERGIYIEHSMAKTVVLSVINWRGIATKYFLILLTHQLLDSVLMRKTGYATDIGYIKLCVKYVRIAQNFSNLTRAKLHATEITHDKLI